MLPNKMNTPRKNENYTSPYATPMQQYPSQSEDYLSLQIGGPGSNRKAPTPYKQQQRGRGRYSSTPAKNYQDSEGGGSGSVGRGANVPYFYQNKQQMGGRGGQNRFNNGNNRNSSYGGNGSGGDGGRQNYHNQNRWSNNGRGGRGGGQRNFNKDDISSYFHPTMLEDPWLDLMERHNAIRRSEINLQAATSERKLREDSSDDEEAEGEDGV